MRQHARLRDVPLDMDVGRLGAEGPRVAVLPKRDDDFEWFTREAGEDRPEDIN